MNTVCSVFIGSLGMFAGKNPNYRLSSWCLRYVNVVKEHYHDATPARGSMDRFNPWKRR